MLDLLVYKIYNYCIPINKEVNTIAPLARTGRPKLEESKSKQIAIRFTNEEFEELENFSEKKKMSKSDVVRKSVKKYISDDQNK